MPGSDSSRLELHSVDPLCAVEQKVSMSIPPGSSLVLEAWLGQCVSDNHDPISEVKAIREGRLRSTYKRAKVAFAVYTTLGMGALVSISEDILKK